MSILAETPFQEAALGHQASKKGEDYALTRICGLHLRSLNGEGPAILSIVRERCNLRAARRALS